MNELKMASQQTFNSNGLRRRLAALICAVSAMLSLASLLSIPATAQRRVVFPPLVPKKHPDYNGDGIADLAIGAPGERVGTVKHVGAVHVVFGSSAMFVWPKNQTVNVPIPSSGLRFGASLAWGDFNRDGFDDLAIGTPGDSLGIGSVMVVYGTKSGLRRDLPGTQLFWTRNQLVGPGWHTEDSFGYKLAAGDFNHDGFADLAVSVQGTFPAVHIIYGGTSGLKAAGNQMFLGSNQALATGDFNKDGCADLAVGASWDTIGGKAYAGAVLIHYGTPYGLEPSAQFWSKDSPGVLGDSAAYDYFGYALATGDFNKDGRVDLAIAAEGNFSSSAVHILYGSASGLTAAGNQMLYQGNVWIDVLAAGDFNGDGCMDLAMGMPLASLSGKGGGAVLVYYGSPYGVDPGAAQLWSQDSPSVAGIEEVGDYFGMSLMAADFNRSGHDDLAIGAPGENDHRGAVNVLFGTKAGLTASNNALIMEQLQGVFGNAEAYDWFGTLR